MNKEDTLYDRIVRKLKNKPIIVSILLIFVMIIAISQFLGGVSEIINTFFPDRGDLEITIYIQHVDLMSSSTESSEILGPIYGDIDDIQHIGELIARQIVETIQPQTTETNQLRQLYFETTLEISGNNLQSSQLVHAYIILLGVEQVGRVVREFGKTESLNLTLLFQELYFDPMYNCTSMTIGDLDGHFENELLQIFKHDDNNFSFDAEKKIANKTIRIFPRKKIIIIETFDVGGANPEIVDSVRISLDSALRNELEAYEFIKISSLTQEDLRRIRDENQALPVGHAKEELIRQSNVHFIVKGSVVIKQGI